MDYPRTVTTDVEPSSQETIEPFSQKTTKAGSQEYKENKKIAYINQKRITPVLPSTVLPFARRPSEVLAISRRVFILATPPTVPRLHPTLDTHPAFVERETLRRHGHS